LSTTSLIFRKETCSSKWLFCVFLWSKTPLLCDF